MLNTSLQTHQYQEGLSGEQADRFAYLHKLQSAALVEQFQNNLPLLLFYQIGLSQAGSRSNLTVKPLTEV